MSLLINPSATLFLFLIEECICNYRAIGPPQHRLTGCRQISSHLNQIIIYCLQGSNLFNTESQVIHFHCTDEDFQNP